MKPASPEMLRSGERLVSLDVFRGACISLMILVNNPGTWGAIYQPLRHENWHGWTFADLIFPFFLFIVGVSIVLSHTKAIANGIQNSELIRKSIIRSGILFVLGLLMAAYPYFTLLSEHMRIVLIDSLFGLHNNLVEVRIMGVLQRIALCYLAASILFLYLKPATIVKIIAGILLFYWAAMVLIPVPGFGAGMIDDSHTNFSAWVDQLIFADVHLYRNGPYDPEGLFSTLPAIGTTLLGVITGNILMSDRNPMEKTVRFLLWGFILVSIGYMWNWFFPINKPIWSSSYVVFSAGIAMQAFGVCYWIIDVKGYRRFTRFFEVYGLNALTVFYMSGIVAWTISLIQIPYYYAPGGYHSLQRHIFTLIFQPIATDSMASLMYAITWVVLWYFVLSYLYKRRIIIKI